MSRAIKDYFHKLWFGKPVPLILVSMIIGVRIPIAYSLFPFIILEFVKLQIIVNLYN